MASIISMAGSYNPSNTSQLATDSVFSMNGSEDVIVIGKPLEPPDSPLNRDYESRHSGSSAADSPVQPKDHWSSKIEFILSSLSMFLGLGSVWRFPFTVYENGGGAFLIPYLIFLFGLAKPLAIVDLTLGQFSGRGPFAVWDVVPILRGVGVVTILIAAITSTYVCAILSFCVAYMYRGLTSQLPWVECNTALYINREFIENLTCSPDPGEEYPTLDVNSTAHYKSNAELYFEYNVMKLKENIDDGIGFPDMELTCCLFTVWFLLFCSFLCGAKSTGKVAIFTAIFPPVVLLAVLVKALCLEGASVGIIYFFKPDWKALLTFKVWRNALSQAFFSMAVGYGSMVYGSFNHFREGIKTDAIIISIVDIVYCTVAGTTVFSILGELSHRKGLAIEQVAQGDLGLAFVTYPEVLTYFGPAPWPQIFSFAFFAMLLSMGIGHSAAYIHPILVTVYDIFPAVFKTRARKILLTAVVCFIGFLCGLIYTAPGGLFIVHLTDHLLTGIVVYSSVVVELVGIFWIYGVSNYCQDMEFMMGTKIPTIYKLWCYCVPFFMLAVGLYTIFELEEPVVHVNHMPVEFPQHVLSIAYLVTFVSVAIIPAGAIIVFCTRKTRSCGKKYMASVYPSPKWGPSDPEIRRQWEMYKKSFQTKKNEPRPYQILIGQLTRRKHLQREENGTEMEFDGGDIENTSPSVVCNVQIGSITVSGSRHDETLEQYREL